ncbi:MAG: hypothetical protein DHS80DRAFT_24996 [Piptocephalis tieghemiana]|nr:MAG: hypothetical protein DHS80DRAFT_24996 [Piptocephalis tieghemiana]
MDSVIKRPDGSYTLDYTNSEANRLLAEITLKEYYDLVILIPRTNLCPKIPNRASYIMWIERLMRVMNLLSPNSSRDSSAPLQGMDIGTGATCIYPLMACRRHPNLIFLATDISEESLECAQRNVNANGLHDRIRLAQTSPFNTLPVELIKQETTRYDFCMCNPPFYSSWEEVVLAQKAKVEPPSAPVSGQANELITVGGERAFIHRMIRESKEVTDKVRWFTTMVGKRETMLDMILFFKEYEVEAFTLGDIQIGKTHRWVIAWSFSEDRPITSLMPKVSQRTAHLQPTGQYTAWIDLPRLRSVQAIYGWVEECVMGEWGVREMGGWVGEGEHLWVGRIEEVTWTRKAKRRRKGECPGQQMDDPIQPKEPLKIAILLLPLLEEKGWRVEVWCVQGKDSGVFDSFSSIFLRRLRSVVDGWIKEGEGCTESP